MCRSGLSPLWWNLSRLSSNPRISSNMVRFQLLKCLTVTKSSVGSVIKKKKSTFHLQCKGICKCTGSFGTLQTNIYRHVKLYIRNDLWPYKGAVLLKTIYTDNILPRWIVSGKKATTHICWYGLQIILNKGLKRSWEARRQTCAWTCSPNGKVLNSVSVRNYILKECGQEWLGLDTRIIL